MIGISSSMRLLLIHVRRVSVLRSTSATGSRLMPIRSVCGFMTDANQPSIMPGVTLSTVGLPRLCTRRWRTDISFLTVVDE